VDEGQLKLAHKSEGKARKACRGSLLGRIPKPTHLFAAPRQQLTRFGVVGEEKVHAAHEIDWGSRQGVIVQPVGNGEALLDVRNGSRILSTDIAEPSEPIEQRE